MSAKFGTTIGFERRYNPALQAGSREEFVEFMNASLPPRPSNMLHIVRVNQGRAPYNLTDPVAEPLDSFEVEALIERGGIVVDTRSAAQFGAGHIAGSINALGSSGQFEQYVGWTVPPDPPLVLVVDDERTVPGLLKKLAVVGLDGRVAGYLEGGVGAWRGTGKRLRSLPQLSVTDLHALRADQRLPVLDVREPSEWHAGHIPGSINSSYRDIGAGVARLPFERREPLAVVCASGTRSSLAASLLLRQGYRDVINVAEGTDGWRRAGYELER